MSRNTQHITGIVADLSHAAGRELAETVLAEVTVPQPLYAPSIPLLDRANELGSRYIIVIPNLDNNGVLSALCDDKQGLISAFKTINAQVNARDNKTAWLIRPESCSELLRKVVRRESKK
jgi:hypothetical protein